MQDKEPLEALDVVVWVNPPVRLINNTEHNLIYFIFNPLEGMAPFYKYLEYAAGEVRANDFKIIIRG